MKSYPRTPLTVACPACGATLYQTPVLPNKAFDQNIRAFKHHLSDNGCEHLHWQFTREQVPLPLTHAQMHPDGFPLPR